MQSGVCNGVEEGFNVAKRGFTAKEIMNNSIKFLL